MSGLAILLCSLAMGGASQAQPDVSRSGPTIRIANVAVNANHTVTIKVAIRGLTLAPGLVGKGNVVGKGHWHMYVNGKSNNDAATTSGTTKTLPKGAHTMYVTLNRNDHSPLAMPTRSRAITVRVG